MKINSNIINWLMDGDVSIRYQTQKDLLGNDDTSLRKKIQYEGWGEKFISFQKESGYWGDGFYQPKWISTHYTLLDLRNLWIYPKIKSIGKVIDKLFEYEIEIDGGLNPGKTITKSDVCVNGMALTYMCYFGASEDKLKSVVDFIIGERLPDGGFNCQYNRKGAVHSSLHSTISVMEGIWEYKQNNYKYRLNDLENAFNSSLEFILMHKLFRSDKTNEIIKKDFLRFPYPPRWKYDILRAMDFFALADVKFDERMSEAIEFINSKQTNEGKWKLAAYYPGKQHFKMEEAGKPSRWNTLRALRVLKKYC